LHAMFLCSEAVNRELTAGTLVFVVPGNVDEVGPIEPTMTFSA
jgi:hypothetical protein